MGILYQVIGTAILSFVTLNTGIMILWPASTIVMFASNNTVLNRPMTETEISLVGSLSSIGGILSTVMVGFLFDKLGRKKCAITIATSLALSWAVLAATRQVEVVLVCTFFSGYSTASILVSANYISEICQDSIRGAMTASNIVFYNTGMTLLYLLGGQLSYEVLLYVGITMNIISLALLFLIKDSPVYLMKIGQEKEARESIAFFRQLKVDDERVIKEINVIKSALQPEIDETSPENEQLNPDSKTQTEKMTFWKFMKKSQSTRRALLLINVVIFTSVYQGLTAVEIYVDSLFSEAVPSISPMTCSVIMAGIIVIAGVVSAYLSDIVGRQPLMIYGSLSTVICCVTLGTQLQFHWGPSWITAVLLYLYPVTYAIGAGTVPTVLIAELFLPEVKGILTMVCVVSIHLWCGVSIYIIYPLINGIGWGPLFYIFATMSFISAAICFFWLPETKGLSVEEVQPLFQKKKNRNHC